MPPPPNLAELLDTRNYPGMIPDESRILRAFIAIHGAEYDAFKFNERLGEGIWLPAHVPEKDRRDWERNTRARPDVIGWLAPNRADIIEAKQQATLETIWQVLAYFDLYVAAFPTQDVHAVIVAETATPNAITLAQNRHVRMFLYTFMPDTPLEPGAEAAAS
jgi:hypothetical protein